MDGKKKNTYVCGLCYKSHPTVAERNKCENECLEKAKIKAVELKEKEKIDKRAEINNAISHVDTLVKAYNKEYGENFCVNFSINENTPLSDERLFWCRIV